MGLHLIGFLPGFPGTDVIVSINSWSQYAISRDHVPRLFKDSCSGDQLHHVSCLVVRKCNMCDELDNSKVEREGPLEEDLNIVHFEQCTIPTWYKYESFRTFLIRNHPVLNQWLTKLDPQASGWRNSSSSMAQVHKTFSYRSWLYWYCR